METPSFKWRNMSSKKLFPILFFSVIIAALDFAVYRLLGSFAEYNVAISLLATNLIYVFLAVKVGCSGTAFVHVVLRALMYLMISPYPWHYLAAAVVGGVLGEIALLFVKRKRAFLPNIIVYLVFHLVYALRDFISFEHGFVFQMNESIYTTYGALAGSFILSFVIARAILMPRLRTAGIEK